MLFEAEAAAAEKALAAQAGSMQKLAERMAELRAELTAAKKEALMAAPTPPPSRRPADPEMAVAKAVGDWLEVRATCCRCFVLLCLTLEQGPGVVSDEVSAVELVARHEMQQREKDRARKAPSNPGSNPSTSRVPNQVRKRRIQLLSRLSLWQGDAFFEGAADPITITAELFRARGLMGKDSRCEAYPKGFFVVKRGSFSM